MPESLVAFDAEDELYKVDATVIAKPIANATDNSRERLIRFG